MNIGKDWIGSFIRNSLSALAGALLAKGWIDGETHGFLAAAIPALSSAIAIFLTAQLWSMWQKIQQRIKVKVAHEMNPATSSLEDVEEVTAKQAKISHPIATVKKATSDGTLKVPKKGSK